MHMVHSREEGTHIRCLFLGPGLPRTLAPSPFATAAERLTPFFFSGGPMADGAGVPPLAGVAGFESEPFSGFEAGGAGTGVEEGESLTSTSFMGVSSLSG